MAVKVKTWIWIVVGIVGCGILCVIAVAGAGIYFFSQHFETKAASTESATLEFEQAKSRFVGQKPLIELDERGRFKRTNPDRPARGDTRTPDQLNVLAFDPDDQRMVKVTVPFWLLRLKSRGATVDFNGGRMDLDDLKLSVEDLERFGPTLIVDHTTSDGERVLVWSQ
jgi:hypothetical protein